MRHISDYLVIVIDPQARMDQKNRIDLLYAPKNDTPFIWAENVVILA